MNIHSVGIQRPPKTSSKLLLGCASAGGPAVGLDGAACDLGGGSSDSGSSPKALLLDCNEEVGGGATDRGSSLKAVDLDAAEDVGMSSAIGSNW
mmetsp:Transcript_30286/g.45633  ORF Transcript_30286/g.45633 Transcript_30286/m.45633 type:complete len:94 (+) Transcript_30286:73-354(+)|eukprot:CAMPEP_0194754302 /NCGR_PEP_ID=MMETSP0323_2-20130528/8259_1 /TAXON_ID=2866 ORGANISM="Crypthecodinium cohnii, Strain Seligo" /NCGR_SAMPLE_ID=MMETSP0323_2 /ASSEMBLY_ACC=CAM_ASM_000346 /LENGTH=93 /DNA_ID=CAMNT_0039672731 /DNA_START=31 /DNA_END=312 /DNA_ORIENTATION=-